jgi:hypothetical protein
MIKGWVINIRKNNSIVKIKSAFYLYFMEILNYHSVYQQSRHVLTNSYLAKGNKGRESAYY